MDKKIRILKSERMTAKNNDENTEWIDQELAGFQFTDERHKKRFKELLTQMWNGFGENHSFSMPGLGKHESSLSIFFKQSNK